MKYEIAYDLEDSMRIDKFLSEKLKFSRSQIKNYIDKGKIFVNNKTVKSSYKLSFGDLIVFDYIEEKFELIPEEIDFETVYEDEEISVINKPIGLVVHPSEQTHSGTLVNGLIKRYETLGNMDSIRPGIVHRLDKDTSGLLVIAKTDFSYNFLVDTFSKGEVLRNYMAICHGKIEEEMTIDAPIGRNEKIRTKMGINYKNGKRAITKIKPIRNFENYTLLDIRLETGRTHQIRVHLASINRPVVGDMSYGIKNNFGVKTQALHAYRLGIIHPVTHKKMIFETKMPDRFSDIIRRIEDEEGFE